MCWRWRSSRCSPSSASPTPPGSCPPTLPRVAAASGETRPPGEHARLVGGAAASRLPAPAPLPRPRSRCAGVARHPAPRRRRRRRRGNAEVGGDRDRERRAVVSPGTPHGRWGAAEKQQSVASVACRVARSAEAANAGYGGRGCAGGW